MRRISDIDIGHVCIILIIMLSVFFTDVDRCVVVGSWHWSTECQVVLRCYWQVQNHHLERVSCAHLVGIALSISSSSFSSLNTYSLTYLYTYLSKTSAGFWLGGQCPLAAWGEENLTTKWCILKYIWINNGLHSAVLYTCLPWLLSKYNINIENCFFCMFSLFNFSSIFPERSADPICPYVRTPMLLVSFCCARVVDIFCNTQCQSK